VRAGEKRRMPARLAAPRVRSFERSRRASSARASHIDTGMRLREGIISAPYRLVELVVVELTRAIDVERVEQQSRRARINVCETEDGQRTHQLALAHGAGSVHLRTVEQHAVRVGTGQSAATYILSLRTNVKAVMRDSVICGGNQGALGATLARTCQLPPSSRSNAKGRAAAAEHAGSGSSGAVCRARPTP
jgi:hypothetical protein